MLSCRLASGPLWLGIYPFLWWFLLVIFVLFLLHWRYELPCQDKLPEFHCTPILGCIRVLWLVFQPLGLRLDKALCGWNSVRLAPHGGEVSASSDPSEDKFPLDHHLDPQMVPHQNRRALQSSSGLEMKRIHLDPSLCLPLTPVT